MKTFAGHSTHASLVYVAFPLGTRYLPAYYPGSEILYCTSFHQWSGLELKSFHDTCANSDYLVRRVLVRLASSTARLHKVCLGGQGHCATNLETDPILHLS